MAPQEAAMLEFRVTNDISPSLEAYTDKLVNKLVQAMGDSSRLVVATATGTYMRDAKGEPRRRRKDDSGPLRIVSGRLARSLTGARKGGRNPESVYELSIGGGEIRLTFGSSVPYSRIHEFGGTAGKGAVIPARPYLGPALEEERQNIASVFRNAITDLAQEVGLA